MMTVPTWLNQADYPFRSCYTTQGGAQMHYVDEGSGELLLYVHGTPSWSFDFRHVITALSPDYRIIAPDHIGFGLSEKPTNYDYSPHQHSRNLEQFLLERDLRNITLVVHDFGGPIGVDVALRHPERFRRLVVLNSWLWSSEEEPEFQKQRQILKSPLLPLLYRYFNFSPKVLLPRSFGERKLSKAAHRYYIRPFAQVGERSGPLAFARSLLHDQGWFDGLWKQRSALEHLPTLLVWGEKDPLLPSRFLKKFQQGFPHAQVVCLPTCGHVPQEEMSDAVTAALRQFFKTT
jgi:pimeloyl-ACP methyl ester carboxylesterase